MAYIFPLAVLVTSIPIYSIIIRYNLLENRICGKVLANVFAVIFPWVAALVSRCPRPSLTPRSSFTPAMVSRIC